jgi:hypothetical protein
MSVTFYDAQIPVQAAILAALSANTYIATNTIPVLDMVPKDQPVPFIVIGDFTAVDNSTTGIAGQVLTLSIHCWDQDLSTLKLKTMMREITKTLHDQPLALADPLSETTFTCVNIRFVNSQVFKDPDGLTVHSVQKFRVVTQSS